MKTIAFSQEEKDKIKAAVQEAEKKTSGEIVPIIVKSSDIYQTAHLRSAIFFSVLSSLIIYLSPHALWNPWPLLVAQALGLFIGYFLACHPVIKRVFLSKKQMSAKVDQRMRELFFSHGLYKTKQQTGVLIFVSLFERQIRIMADKGINDKVASNTWDTIVRNFITHVRQDKVSIGFCETIQNVGAILEQHFPIEVGDTNELADDLIIE